MLKVRQGVLGTSIPTSPAVGTTKVIRRITPSAMQRRFTIPEETAIVDLATTALKLARERLLNASYVDLDLAEVATGINAIVNFLAVTPVEEGSEEMIVTDVATRVSELLSNGLAIEAP